MMLYSDKHHTGGAVSAEQRPGPDAFTAAASAGGGGRIRLSERPTILVVDDDAHDRAIYGEMLCYNGFDVVFARSGEAALRLADGYEVAAVLLDIGLPDLTGLEVLRRLRARAWLRTTPVITLSGFPSDKLAGPAHEAGCDVYMEKPVSPVEVLHAVEARTGRAPLSGDGTPPQRIDPAELETSP